MDGRCMKPSPELRWSDLPPEILHLISFFLTNIWDHLRFRSVCSSWRSSAAAATPPQTPSLLLPYNINSTARSFLDPSDFRIHTIDIPDARGKWTYGTPHGWLLMVAPRRTFVTLMYNVSLLNPITRAHISLPPLPPEISFLPEQLQGEHIKPVLTADNLVAILVYNKLAFCRVGEEAWMVIDVKVKLGIKVLDFTYFDGEFYVLHRSKGVTVVNPISLEKSYSGPPSPEHTNHVDSFHLVESSRDLLLVERSYKGVVPVSDVYKLDRSGERMKWVTIEESIGDRALFVSCNRSSISVPSYGFRRGGGDLICFAGCASYSDHKIANISISDIAVGSSTGREQIDWQGSRVTGGYEGTLLGLTWIRPSL